MLTRRHFIAQALPALALAPALAHAAAPEVDYTFILPTAKIAVYPGFRADMTFSMEGAGQHLNSRFRSSGGVLNLDGRHFRFRTNRIIHSMRVDLHVIQGDHPASAYIDRADFTGNKVYRTLTDYSAARKIGISYWVSATMKYDPLDPLVRTVRVEMENHKASI